MLEVIRRHPKQIAQFLDGLPGINREKRNVPNGMIVLSFLGRCLNRLLVDELPADDAFIVKGKTTMPGRPTPRAQLAEIDLAQFELAVVTVTEIAFQRKYEKNLHDTCLYISELFEMDDQEQTIKSWRNKYRKSSAACLEEMAAYTSKNYPDKATLEAYARTAARHYRSMRT